MERTAMCDCSAAREELENAAFFRNHRIPW